MFNTKPMQKILYPIRTNGSNHVPATNLTNWTVFWQSFDNYLTPTKPENPVPPNIHKYRFFLQYFLVKYLRIYKFFLLPWTCSNYHHPAILFACHVCMRAWLGWVGDVSLIFWALDFFPRWQTVELNMKISSILQSPKADPKTPSSIALPAATKWFIYM